MKIKLALIGGYVKNNNSNYFNNFKNNYNKIIQEQNNLVSRELKQVNATNILDVKVLNAQQDFATLDANVKKLRIQSTIFTTLSVTATSIAISTLLVCINISLVKYDKELNGIDRASLTFGVTYKLGNIFYEILKPTLIVVEGTLTATTWAVPAVIAVIGVIATISSWIRLFK